MKPRNKFEKAVAELNATLSEDIAATNAEWAKKECEKWGMSHFCYFTISDEIGCYNVKRLYRIYQFKDKGFDHFFFVEIMRCFDDGANKLYFAKHRQMGHYYDCFSYDSDIELRQVYKNYANYDITDLFSLSMTTRTEDRGSKRIACVRLNPNELGRIIKGNPIAENLYKKKDPLFVYLLFEPYAKPVCKAIARARRHGFNISLDNAGLWFDMVRAIIYCKKDYMNPVYIAPKDLKATHDMFIDMMQRKKRKEAERRRREAEERRHQMEYEATLRKIEQDKTYDEKYIRRRKRFYDMVLTDGLIECKVLRNIEEFKEEGQQMDHCVYRSEYFNKVYSLVLSARIGGERIETVEVSLKEYKILQCYGKHDHFTMYHKRILDLVNSHMDVIKRYNTSHTIKKAM